MTTPARPLATCILRWIYEQASALLQMLKQALLSILAAIDAQIAVLRAWLAQWDLLARADEYLNNLVQQIIEQIRNTLVSFPGGPLQELCPEFYSYFLDPALALFDTIVNALNVARSRYKNEISFMDEVDYLISYWEQIKADLLFAIEVLDDAIYKKLVVEAAQQVP
jgi:hypothetical protein